MRRPIRGRGPTDRSAKELLIGLHEPNARLAQVVAKIKDVVGAVADVNSLLAGQNVNIRMNTAYLVPGESYGIYNAFVELRDPKLSLNQLVDRLRQSAFVLHVQAIEGSEGLVVDTLSFPLHWQGRRVVVMAQQSIARTFESVRLAFGSGGDAILYNQGTDYGKGLAGFLMDMLGRNFLLRHFEYALNLFAATGWGIPRLDTPASEFPDITVRISSCLECSGIGSGRMSCNFMRGFLSGISSTITGQTVQCEETQCAAKANSNCVFNLHGQGSEVDSQPGPYPR